VRTASKETHEVPLLLEIRHSNPDLIELLLNQGAAIDLVLIPIKTHLSGTYLSATVRIDEHPYDDWDTEESSMLSFSSRDIQYLIDHAQKATVRLYGYTSESRQYEFNGTILH
jgi:hypothetical protein